MNFTIPSKLRTITLALMAIGLVGSIYGFVTDTDRAWANLLINSFFFLGIALAASFFIAVNLVGESGWWTAIKRVPEAISQYLPFGAVAMLVVLVSAVLGLNHIYHWMDSEVVKNDYIIAAKSGYLNIPFFSIRTIIYLAGWIFFTMQFRKISLQHDLNSSESLLMRSRGIAAGFLVFFAVTSSTAAWDWLMSIDTHWFSTLFGWYIFAGIFVSAIITINIVIVLLKKQGYLPKVNESHLHDVAKYMFAFSIFWTYLYFSQFLLIWYANIPEEIVYYMERFRGGYKPIIITMIIINFVFPLLILMTRDAKRKENLVLSVGFVLLIGHWLDMFQIVMPGTVADKWAIGITEISMLLGFAGLFTFVTANALAKAPLDPVADPFLEESYHHEV